MRPRLLDLYSGAGGAAVGYDRAGFDVVGVDINPQPRYPFEHHVADALEFLAARGHEFDAVHASPPCQNASALTAGNRRRPGWSDGHLDLIPATRTALANLSVPTVIENVQGAAVRRDLTLCGLTFGLRVFRHRYFEVTGFTALQPPHNSHRGHRVSGWRHGVRHDGDMVAVYGEGGGKGNLADWSAAMDIHWMERAEIREAIPPAYAQFVGEQLLAHLTAGAAA